MEKIFFIAILVNDLLMKIVLDNFSLSNIHRLCSTKHLSHLAEYSTHFRSFKISAHEILQKVVHDCVQNNNFV